MLKSEEPVFPRDDLSYWIVCYPISSAQSRDHVHTSNIKCTQQVMYIDFLYILCNTLPIKEKDINLRGKGQT